MLLSSLHFGLPVIFELDGYDLYPYCSEPVEEFVLKPAKEKLGWFEFSRYHSLYPHCMAEIALEAKFQRRGLLLLPAIVLFVRDVALSAQGGVIKMLHRGALCLAVFGLIMLYSGRIGRC